MGISPSTIITSVNNTNGGGITVKCQGAVGSGTLYRNGSGKSIRFAFIRIVFRGSTIEQDMSTLITDNVNTGTIKDSTGNTTAITIDSSGRVFKPQIPFISMLRNADDYTVGNTITDFRVEESRGITHSNGVMTVPVAGCTTFTLMES